MIQKYDSIKNKHIHILILSNAIITIVSIFATLFVMYNISLTENKNRLKELAQNQARIIEAVSNYDLNNISTNNTPNDAWNETLSQIKTAHKKYRGFGKTGEFTLGKKQGDKIIFLLSHRHYDLDNPKPVPLNSKFAQPMKAALFFNSGVMTGLDYRGEIVVAAFEPVKTHIGNLGIVAKIDLSEIREPFLFTGIIILSIAIFVIAWTSWLFFRTLTPIVNKQKDSILALQRSESLLSQSQDISNIGSWDWNLKDNTAYWSDSMYKIYGRLKSQGVPTSDNWEKDIHPDDIESLKKAILKALETRKLNIKYRIIKPNGKLTYAHSIAEVEYDEEGEAIRMLGALRDITDEVLAKEKILRQEKFLKNIFDNTPSLIILMDEFGVLTQINKYAELISGYKRKEILGKEKFDFCVPSNYKEEARKILESIVSEERKNEEFLIPILSKDEELYSVSWRISLYDYENTKYILAVGLDITESKNLETKYQNLYGRMRDGYVSVDLEGKLTEVNDSFCEMLGYTQDELLKMNFLEFTPEKWHKSDKEVISMLKSKFDSTKLFEKEYIRKDGTILPVELRVSTVMNNTLDELIGYWALVRDISERKKIEEELQSKEELMISQSRQVAMGDMVAMIAHQWRQPITAITMVANNILMDISFDDVSIETLKKDMDKIIYQTKYLSTTIDDFRNFFNPKNEKNEVSLGKVLADAIAIIGKSFENNKIGIKLDILNDPVLNIFEKELLQVLLIILNNAKDAILSKNINNGLVQMEIGVKGELSYIKIADNGGGISKDIIKKLGEPYVTSKLSKGTGLGLYMANIIVTKHMNGNLQWYNNEDGACIDIMIPREKRKEIE